MKPDLNDKWLACRVYGDDGYDIVAVQLDVKTASAIRRAVEAWRAAASAYGNEDVSLSVSENFAYWVMSVPTVWPESVVTARWQVIETTPIAALAFAGEGGDLDELIASSLLEQEVIMSNSDVRVNGPLHVRLEGRPKYQSGDFATPDFPKEVIDWIMG